MRDREGAATELKTSLERLKTDHFDSVLFPVNFACWLQKDFGPAILDAAKAKGCACLALKGLAHQKWPKDDPARKKYSKCWYQPLIDPEEAKLCLRWTLSQPITAAVTPGEEPLMRLALEVGTNFKPVTAKEVEQVKKLASTADPIFPAQSK
jgi:predicted aldo/keto reductase-like oxidoreductase